RPDGAAGPEFATRVRQGSEDGEAAGGRERRDRAPCLAAVELDYSARGGADSRRHHVRSHATSAGARLDRSPAYRRLEELISSDRCVVLDGGVATELQRLAPVDGRAPDPELWGTWALYRAPRAVAEVHRRYVEAGCNVISTDTWSILSTPEAERSRPG